MPTDRRGAQDVLADKEDNDHFLVFLCEDVGSKILRSELFVRNCLAAIVDSIGMHAVGPPVVVRTEKNAGFEGWQPIDDSNVTLSTYEANRPRVLGCIHSCRTFDVEAALEVVKEACDSNVVRWLEFSERDMHEGQTTSIRI